MFVAQPPLYSTIVGKETVYLKDDVAKNRFLEERPNHKAEFSRLKGIGEMDWDELRDTTMKQDTRTLLRVSADEAAAGRPGVQRCCSVTTSKSRKKFIVTNADDVRFLDI